MSTSQPTWCLFDLGGIVVPETGDAVMETVAGFLGITLDRARAIAEPYRKELTTGKLSLLDMYTEVVETLGIGVDPAVVLAVHLDTYRKAASVHDPDVLNLVERLKITCHVGCLTNTEIEIGGVSRETGLFDAFERAYLSVELGLQKPDAAIYQAVLEDLGCAPEDVLFIDDRSENVVAARKLGMQGLVYHGATELEGELRPRGGV